jgi:hypothetical protein
LRNADADTYACSDSYARRYADPIADKPLHVICTNFYNA